MRRLPSFSDRRWTRIQAFTLVEVLAALLFMAIVIPVTMEGVSVASRAGTLGLRKTAAMRIAERVLDEKIIDGSIASSATSGTLAEGATNYAWTLQSQSWTEDNMTEVTVRVSFLVQGNTYEVSASTLYDPTAGSTTTSTSTPTP